MRLLATVLSICLLLSAPVRLSAEVTVCPIKEFISICFQNSQTLDQLQNWAADNGWNWKRLRGSNQTFGTVYVTNENDIEFVLDHQNYSDLISISCYLQNPINMLKAPDLFRCGDVSALIDEQLPKLTKIPPANSDNYFMHAYVFESSDQRALIEVATPKPESKLVGVIMKLNKIIIMGNT